MAKKNTPPTRRAVMKAFGEYLDFANWLADAKHGINVEPQDMSPSEIALATKRAEARYLEKVEAYTGRETLG